LHNRNSAADFIQIIKEHRSSFTAGVVHSFDGTWEEAQAMIQDLDLYIGINGCSLRTAQNLDTVKQIPLDRLMIETDAPWCDIRSTHASFQFAKDVVDKEPWETEKKEKFEFGSRVKGRNEPCTLPQILHVIARLKDMNPEEVAEQVYSNTCRVFFT
jgi:TatD DNase family protein